MKRILFAAAFVIGLSAFAAAQTQDTTGRMNKKGTMNKSGKKMKKNSGRNGSDSTGRSGSDSTGAYGTMNNNRRRDSM